MRSLIRSHRRQVESLFLFAFVVLAGFSAAAHPLAEVPTVTKVEPPFWWANHSINPVRLLVRGKNLNGATIRSIRSGITASNTSVNTVGTYLFVDITVDRDAARGAYPLTIKTARGEASVTFTVEPTLDMRKNFQGITTDDVIYLIMTDRFANGDTRNDEPADSPPEANSRKNARGFHGGDFRGIINRLPYLKDLGVTALWLTPWYDNWNGLTSCDKPWCPHTYYHGYHPIDYYAIEDRFGDMTTLRELVDKAHALGIKIIQDQVANHVGLRHPWTTDPPGPNWYHGTAANHLLNKFQNSALLSPNGNPDEVRNSLDGWFNDDLPDMNHENPEVKRYEIQNSLWWLGTTGVDGIRQDTIQYMPRFFIRDLSEALHRQYPTMWMVGEVMDHDPAHTSFFIGNHVGWDGIDTKLDSVFDFPLWEVSRKAFTKRAPLRALRDVLKYDALYPDASRVTTMVSNHDTVRFMSLPGANIEGAMMHMAFTLAVRGTPQLYYGEEIAMEGKDDPDNRRDFPGGFPNDERNAFEASGRSEDEQRMHSWTREWIKLRRAHSSIRRGRLIDLVYDDNTYVFARKDQNETIIFGFNSSGSKAEIVISANTLGLKDAKVLTTLIGTRAGFPIQNGKISMTLPARTAVAFLVK